MCRILVPYYLAFEHESPRAWPCQRQAAAAPSSHILCVFLLSDRSTTNRAWCAVTRRSGPALLYSSHCLRLPRTTANRFATSDWSTVSPTVPRPTSCRLAHSRSFVIVASSSQELRTSLEQSPTLHWSREVLFCVLSNGSGVTAPIGKNQRYEPNYRDTRLSISRQLQSSTVSEAGSINKELSVACRQKTVALVAWY